MSDRIRSTITTKMIKPLAGAVLVKKQLENKTAGGLFVPDSAAEEKGQYAVVAVGTGVTEIEIGDRLIIKGRPVIVEFEGDRYGLIEAEGVIGIIRG